MLDSTIIIVSIFTERSTASSTVPTSKPNNITIPKSYTSFYYKTTFETVTESRLQNTTMQTVKPANTTLINLTSISTSATTKS